MLIEERIVTLFKRNCHHTLTYWSLFWSFGLSIAFLGPTILDLKCQTGSTLREITWVFFSQQFCLLIGSSTGGIFKKTLISALTALFLSALIISVVFAIIPLCYNVLLLAVAMAVSGLAMGIIDTIANIQLVSIYQKDSAIFLQVLHSFIGLGALVSPLIADPFISGHCPSRNSTENATEIFQHFRYSLTASFRSPVILENSPHTGPFEEKASVSYAFWIMALINLPVPIAVLVLMYREKLLPFCPNSTPQLLDKDELAMETQAPGSTETPDPSAEVTGHGDLFSCCMNEDLRGLPVTFFGIHILGGLVLLMTEGLMAGVIVTVLLLLILSTNKVFLFVGTALVGLFLSSVFPFMLAYTEDILDYQGCATPVLVTFAGMGEMSMQVLVGSLIQTEGSYSFMVCSMVLGCLAFILLLALIMCHHIHRNLTGTSKKAAMVEDPPVPTVAPASEKAVIECKLAVIQPEPTTQDSI
ncbi:major facilitator superfamily domain-containing protein 4B-like isoform X2 [Xyrauchen texanus]|uniref:major facilitator superfamily domain-containing protein 4B-like isoform X2 n=1 Tax=Xyrauchen texanus TaxID=154827 RepID=UPI002241F944|nr:major facilitator superfamily domain-containing protein 4B-like isoform X2 [Xyrauchen texanus]